MVIAGSLPELVKEPAKMRLFRLASRERVKVVGHKAVRDNFNAAGRSSTQ